MEQTLTELLQTDDPAEQAQRVAQLLQPTATLVIQIAPITGITIRAVGAQLDMEQTHAILNAAGAHLRQVEREALRRSLPAAAAAEPPEEPAPPAAAAPAEPSPPPAEKAAV